MPYTPNPVPVYPTGPASYSVALPATAKTVFTDTSNTATLVAADADRRRTFGSIYAKQVGAIVAGKIQIYRYDGTTAFLLDELILTASTPNTTTIAGTTYEFTRWSKDTPLTLMEGHSLLVAFTTAQAAGSMIANAALGKVF